MTWGVIRLVEGASERKSFQVEDSELEVDPLSFVCSQIYKTSAPLIMNNQFHTHIFRCSNNDQASSCSAENLPAMIELMSKTSFTVGRWPHDPHLHDNHIF